MVLTFNCRRDGQCYVMDEEREAQYIVKVSHSPRLSGGVYDDLGLSCLVGIEETDEGFEVSAFDTPLGVFKPQPDCIFRMQGEGWEIAKDGNVYFLSHVGEKIADIQIEGTEVTLSTDNSGQVIMVIAAALVVLEHNKAHETVQKPTVKPQKKGAPQSRTTADKQRIITVNTDALKDRLAKVKLDKVVTFATDVIPSIRFRVKGRTLIAMVSAIAVCVALFITGLVATAVKTSNTQNVEYTEAIVSLQESDKATASFKVGDYAYSIELRGTEYKNNERFQIYYLENSDGTLKEYFMTKPSSQGYVALSVVSIVAAVLIFVFMFIGNPLQLRKEWDLKSIIKKLRPTPQQDEEERLVEHTAYVTSADAEPDYFGLRSEQDDNK